MPDDTTGRRGAIARYLRSWADHALTPGGPSGVGPTEVIAVAMLARDLASRLERGDGIDQLPPPPPGPETAMLARLLAGAALDGEAGAPALFTALALHYGRGARRETLLYVRPDHAAGEIALAPNGLVDVASATPDVPAPAARETRRYLARALLLPAALHAACGDAESSAPIAALAAMASGSSDGDQAAHRVAARWAAARGALAVGLRTAAAGADRGQPFLRAMAGTLADAGGAHRAPMAPPVHPDALRSAADACEGVARDPHQLPLARLQAARVAHWARRVAVHGGPWGASDIPWSRNGLTFPDLGAVDMAVRAADAAQVARACAADYRAAQRFAADAAAARAIAIGDGPLADLMMRSAALAELRGEDVAATAAAVRYNAARTPLPTPA